MVYWLVYGNVYGEEEVWERNILFGIENTICLKQELWRGRVPVRPAPVARPVADTYFASHLY